MLNITPRTRLSSMLGRFDPFRDEDWFRGFWPKHFLQEMDMSPQIKIDLKENDKSYIVRAEIPGAKKEDIKVQVDGNRVTISSEFKQEKEEKKDDKIIYQECHQGASYRSFTLDCDVDEAASEAKYENGVLELTLPKKNGAMAKQLQIK